MCIMLLARVRAWDGARFRARVGVSGATLSIMLLEVPWNIILPGRCVRGGGRATGACSYLVGVMGVGSGSLKHDLPWSVLGVGSGSRGRSLTLALALAILP